MKLKEKKNEAANKVLLSPPWATYYREINALFAEDKDVHVIYDEDGGEIKLYVDNADKADALMTLLPETKEFGNVSIKVTVIPADQREVRTDLNVVVRAFKGNNAVADIQIMRLFGAEVAYVIFEPEVVQFFNDNIASIYGFCSTLYENIARDVIENADNVFFCTENAPVIYGV